MSANLTSILTKPIVDACISAEAQPTPAYRDALAMIAPMSRRFADSDDVASLARVLLADCLAGHDGASLAAGSAVRRSAAWHAARHGRWADERPVGDTASTSATDLLPSAVGGDPADHYRWTTRDTLDALADCQPTNGARDTLAILASQDDAWTGTGRPNVAALARALHVTTGKGRQAVSATACLALQTARDCLPGVLLANDVTSAHKGTGGTERDLTLPTSGPASPCVLTDRHACRWILLADRSSRVTDDGALAALASVSTPAVKDHLGYALALGYGQPERPTLGLPAYVGGTRREIDAPDPMASAPTTRTAGRPAGVGIGMRHGWSGLAGDCAPLPRPAAPAKRKRDGGIGASMVTGATGYGRTGTGTNPAPGSHERCTCEDTTPLFCALHNIRHAFPALPDCTGWHAGCRCTDCQARANARL